ncbi:MAG: energy transducer TonB [Terriglobales bacterium]
MTTLMEVQEQENREQIQPDREMLAPLPASPPLFADVLLEPDGTEKRRRKWAAVTSITFQCVLLGVVLIVPLMFTDVLPAHELLTMLVAPPPPPPPPPPPAAAQAIRRVQSDMTDGHLRTPSRIPAKVEMIREEEAPPQSSGVIGGVPGGIPGGQLGGVIGGIISSSSSISAVPKLVPPKRVRISQGVTTGLLIRKVEPEYPPIAKAAHIQGQVVLNAVISKTGVIENITAISGHPTLVPAAIEAVRQWRYHPYLLNGEPVEVETTITVTFMFAS